MKNALTDAPRYTFDQDKICEGYVVGGQVFWFESFKKLSEFSCEYCQGQEVGCCLLNDGSEHAMKRVAFCSKSECPRPRSKYVPKITENIVWDGFGIPDVYLEKNLENYLFKSEKSRVLCDEFLTHAAKRFWLFTGHVRAGKTHLAIALLKRFREKTGANVMFITHSELYFMIKEAMKNNGEQELLSRLANVPFLVIDDFGVLRGTPMELDITYELLSRRFNKNVKTIMTTNRTEQEINEMYGARLMGRLAEAGSIQKFSRPTETPGSIKNEVMATDVQGGVFKARNTANKGYPGSFHQPDPEAEEAYRHFHPKVIDLDLHQKQAFTL